MGVAIDLRGLGPQLSAVMAALSLSGFGYPFTSGATDHGSRRDQGREHTACYCVLRRSGASPRSLRLAAASRWHYVLSGLPSSPAASCSCCSASCSHSFMRETACGRRPREVVAHRHAGRTAKAGAARPAAPLLLLILGISAFCGAWSEQLRPARQAHSDPRRRRAVDRRALVHRLVRRALRVLLLAVLVARRWNRGSSGIRMQRSCAFCSLLDVVLVVARVGLRDCRGFAASSAPMLVKRYRGLVGKTAVHSWLDSRSRTRQRGRRALDHPRVGCGRQWSGGPRSARRELLDARGARPRLVASHGRAGALARALLRERSRQARRPSRQCGSTGAFSRSLRSTEYAGRGAGRPSSAVVIRRTRQSSPPPRRSPRRTRPTCSRRPREMPDPARQLDQLARRLGEMPDVGRPAALVVDDGDLVALRARAQHRGTKFWPSSRRARSSARSTRPRRPPPRRGASSARTPTADSARPTRRTARASPRRRRSRTSRARAARRARPRAACRRR